MASIGIALGFAAAFTLAQAVTGLPPRFASRSAAVMAGCRMSVLKGAGSETCVLTELQSDPMRIMVYQRSSDGVYTASNEMAITSWSWTAKLSLTDILGTGADGLVIDTAGIHGTGINQRILLAIAWDGSRFRTVATESLGYGCYRPTATADYQLAVDHKFVTTNGKRTLQLKYELTKDKQRIGEWTDILPWDPARFMFVLPPPNAAASNSFVDKVRERIARVRDYSLGHPLDPVKGSEHWIGVSGLMNVLDPVCVQ